MVLDFCVELYQFLRNAGVDCTKNDALKFYYLFHDIVTSHNVANSIRVMVVSRYGYYYAKDLCDRCNKVASTLFVYFVPCEYLELDKIHPSSYTLIATDIDEVYQNHSDQMVIMMHYYRKTNELREIIQNIIISKENFISEIFTIDDLMYTSAINSMEDLYEFIKMNVLSKETQAKKEAFISALKKKNKILSPIRKNAFMIQNTLKDVLNYNLFKIIVPTNDLVLMGEDINCIIVTNIKDRTISTCSLMNRHIVELIHNNRVLFSNNLQTDYHMLVNIMSSNNHL